MEKNRENAAKSIQVSDVGSSIKVFLPLFLQMDLEERLSAALQDAARAKDVLRSMR